MASTAQVDARKERGGELLFQEGARLFYSLFLNIVADEGARVLGEEELCQGEGVVPIAAGGIEGGETWSEKPFPEHVGEGDGGVHARESIITFLFCEMDSCDMIPGSYRRDVLGY